MATIDYGYMGGFNGKLGTAVGYRWRGRWCLRSLAPVHNPRTEAQQRHRMLFKQEVQLAGRMNRVLRTTLDAAALEMHMTACNLFVQSNQHAFSSDDGRLAVQWSELILASGPVAPVAFTSVSVDQGTTLTLTFEKNPLHMRADAYDNVYLYAYCPDIESGFLSAYVYRRSGRIAVALPEAMRGHEVQLWGMVQDQARRWSPTLYVGALPLTADGEWTLGESEAKSDAIDTIDADTYKKTSPLGEVVLEGESRPPSAACRAPR